MRRIPAIVVILCVAWSPAIAAAQEGSVESQSLGKITQDEAVEWANRNLHDDVPKLLGSSSLIGRYSTSGADQLSNAPASSCLYSDEYCQCSKISVGPKEHACLQKVGVDQESGRSVCQEVQCPEEQSHTCACDGDTICRIREGSFSAFALDGSNSQDIVGGEFGHDTYFCHATEIVSVEPADKSETIDHSLPEEGTVARERTVAWNMTHCTCSPKSEVTDHSACFDIVREGETEADPDLCARRECKVAPGEFVCDLLMGRALCERRLFPTQKYAVVQGAAPVKNGEYRPNGLHDMVERIEKEPSDASSTHEYLLPCVRENHASERLNCVSSCL